MRASCLPSPECDDAQDAKKLFDIVSLLCSFFFGIPLALVFLRMITNLTDSIGRSAYMQMGLQTDIVYAFILAVCMLVPVVYTYMRYRRKMEFQR
jgi:hypothetical protein